MPRKPRVEFPGAIHHVTIRGVNRSAIFRDEADNWAFVQLLQCACERYEWRVSAYCLMVNHAHAVIRTPEANLARGMQWLTASYAKRCHSRYRSSGHVFQGRYHAMLVQRDAYLLEVVRYVLLNPVRAGLCRSPADWRWSSARETLGLRPSPSWSDFGLFLELLTPNSNDALAQFAHFLDAGKQQPRRIRVVAR